MINTFRSEISLPIVGIGHSMGACQLANLSLLHPRLFHTLVLIEPVIQGVVGSGYGAGYKAGFIPARASTFRRDIWPTKSASVASFRKQKYYQAWDPRVFDLWLEHGIRLTPTNLYPDERNGAVTLTTTRHQEVWTFMRPHYDISGKYAAEERDAYPDIQQTHMGSLYFYRPEPAIILSFLPYLRPSTFYIFGSESELSPPELQAAKVNNTGTGTGGSGGVKEGRVKSLSFEGVGHLIPMEAVGRTADACAEWVGKELKRWEKQQREYEEWTKLPLRERQEVDEEWKVKIGGPMPRRPLPEAKAKI
jgi:pimeloyl-ACP methyl ester carboxylesterase